MQVFFQESLWENPLLTFEDLVCYLRNSKNARLSQVGRSNFIKTRVSASIRIAKIGKSSLRKKRSTLNLLRKFEFEQIKNAAIRFVYSLVTLANVHIGYLCLRVYVV